MNSNTLARSHTTRQSGPGTHFPFEMGSRSQMIPLARSLVQSTPVVDLPALVTSNGSHSPNHLQKVTLVGRSCLLVTTPVSVDMLLPLPPPLTKWFDLYHKIE